MARLTKQLMVACVGSTNNPNDFGGLPYHLVEAGRENGVIKGGFSFGASRLNLRIGRYLWNARHYAKARKYGGFQYSETFLRSLWRQVPDVEKRAPIINLFQLYPKAEMERATPKFFYLDQTLSQVFHYYGSGSSMSAGWRNDVLNRERQQYAAAEKVFFRSHWAASRAKIDYGLPDTKVAVVLPGANINKEVLDTFDREHQVQEPARNELRLVFVGKEWRRKGLDRLLRAMKIADSQGARLSLSVIGMRPEEEVLKIAEGLQVNWLGFVDKARDPMGFVHLLSQHDIGVLLSRQEAGGVSLREFGRLGMPVIGPNTGGSPEFAMAESAKLVSPCASDLEISEILLDLSADPNALYLAKREAWERRLDFDWTAAVDKLAKLV
ncbi:MULTISPECIES: glycosyltransferase family 4 protein [unclassified Sulfitobacter]|uniref:glycosyltransferase family 4 protein n=1 Tax=unclassified Sulfitobacter TaxID=196795 RepID=UPI003746E30C